VLSTKGRKPTIVLCAETFPAPEAIRAGAKTENELIGGDRIRAGLRRTIDRGSFGGTNLLKSFDDAGEIVFSDVSH
jgi:hypothetical protein